jgi:tRNA A37 threonylcarbamoyladenosine dehydratase
MATKWLQRTELLIGEEQVDKLKTKHVLVVGLGGVGSFAAELICRSGVGKMTIIDGDVVDITNCNRQLPALSTNVGESKAEIMEERLRAINPELELTVIKQFMTPELMEELMKNEYDYAVDCIDSLTPKLTMIVGAMKKGIPLVSSMGAGGKMDPTRVFVKDISKTYACKLAFTVRKRLRKLGVRKGFEAVFSTELPLHDSLMLTDGTNYKRSAYGTISYLPAVFGCTVASVVIRRLIDWKELPSAH